MQLISQVCQHVLAQRDSLERLSPGLAQDGCGQDTVNVTDSRRDPFYNVVLAYD